MKTASFAQRVIDWQRQYGRHHLPWQCEDPYRIWLSEIMLQQTQVSTVIPYYQRFLHSFPDVESLANATQEAVLSHWSGLGYYARARNLHHAAKQICTTYAGKFPQQREELEQLKGIGRSTAAAIAVFAWGEREAICDGNVKRVLARHFAIDADTQAVKSQAIFWQQAQNLLPTGKENLQSYTQGLMDLGSLICKRSKPLCQKCPIHQDCQALQQEKVHEYPRKNTKSGKKSRDGYFLLCELEETREILLVKREENALWGNLWILPWFDSQAALQAFAQEHHMQAQANMQFAFKHVFTHYQLNLYYQHYRMNKDSLLRLGRNYRCFSKSQWQQAALPTAMKKLLNAY